MSTPRPPASRLHEPTPHESATLHVTGHARYTDDLEDPPGLLHGFPVGSPVAHGRLRAVRWDAAGLPAGTRILVAADIPGSRRIGTVVHDEPLLADDELSHVGQPVALALGPSRELARLAAAMVVVEADPLPALLDLDAALAAESFLTAPHRIERGDVEGALASAAWVVSGETRTPGQDHFYLETHNAIAWLDEDGAMRVHSSTQHPTEVQHTVAHVLGWPSARVVSQVARMGGGFGGKESQSAAFAALCAVGVAATGRPVRVRLDRGQDMATTGKRHPFLGRWRAGFTADGRIVALDLQLWSDGGYSTDLSAAVMDRAVQHCDGGCFVPNLRVVGRACRTHLPSNTAFRGFGGPQGAAMMWDVLHHAARHWGLPVEELYARNLYAPGQRTHYGQPVPDPRHRSMLERIRRDAEVSQRRGEIARWNATHPWSRRGLGVHPVQFGISFGVSFLNQAGALVLVYSDGSVQVNHGGTEMGQGLHTKLRAIAASTFGLPADSVRVMTTSTDKVPNTSATAASVGSDINGQAVLDACLQIQTRMLRVAESLVGTGAEFQDGEARGPAGTVSWTDLCRRCWLDRVPLSATGFYATPGVHYDRVRGQGSPYFYFAYGVAVAEVEVSALTGEHRVLRLDVLQDCGDSLNPLIDQGQVEGALVQGMGWLTGEEVLFDRDGRVRTRGPSTYKIPTGGDVPTDFRVTLLPNATQPGVIGGSKAVGEPPLLLAFAVASALRDAVTSWPSGGGAAMALPYTPESLLREVCRRTGQPWG
jgi:xanthine dehydrogenase large subunit